MKNRPIIIMLAYARSGGTLLNRCIAKMPNIIMLSEVNVEALCPSSCNTIKEQAMKWYHINLKTEGFINNVKELYGYCEKNDKILVIRDWPFGSFVPSKYNNFNPSKRLSTLISISKFFPVIPFALVRNSIDVWLSFQASPRTFYDTKLTYLNEFIKCLIEKKIKIFRYEDFCKFPVKTMKLICKYTRMSYSSDFKKFSDYINVTGDTDLPEYSRGIKNGGIGELSRRKIYRDFVDEINNNTLSKKINKLLRY